MSARSQRNVSGQVSAMSARSQASTTPEAAFATLEEIARMSHRQEAALQRLLKDNGSLWGLIQQQQDVLIPKLDRITACVAMLEDNCRNSRAYHNDALKPLAPLPALRAGAVAVHEGKGLQSTELECDLAQEMVKKIDELNVLAHTLGQAAPVTPRDKKTEKKVKTPRTGNEPESGSTDKIVAQRELPHGEPLPSKESQEQDQDAALQLKRESRRSKDMHPGQSSVSKDDARTPWMVQVVSSQPFEMVFAVLILLNTLSMCAEAEYRGWGTGHTIGIEGSQATTAAANDVFHTIEVTFTIVFTVEVVLMLMALQCNFWRSSWNIFDFGIIAIAWFDLLMDVEFPINPMLLRLVRLVRLLRMLKTMRQFEVFDTLFMMVNGIKASVPVLVWVMLLIFPMLLCCALGMNYTLEEFINDETKPEQDRIDCYKYFGTFTRSMVSMFELTFASFVPINRFLYSKVDEKFAILFMCYKLVVGVAVTRIIYGVFLHVSFACAASDEDAMTAQKHRENEKYKKRLIRLFEKLDANGDGIVRREEFIERIHNDIQIKAYLSALGLDVHDAELVFNLTDNGDGGIESEEMVHGFSRLKGNARSIDILSLTKTLEEAFQTILSKLP